MKNPNMIKFGMAAAAAAAQQSRNKISESGFTNFTDQQQTAEVKREENKKTQTSVHSNSTISQEQHQTEQNPEQFQNII